MIQETVSDVSGGYSHLVTAFHTEENSLAILEADVAAARGPRCPRGLHVNRGHIERAEHGWIDRP